MRNQGSFIELRFCEGEIYMQRKNLIVTAIGAVALGVVIGKFLQTRKRVNEFASSTNKPEENEIDRTIDDSFPASDPPSWSSGNIH